MAAGITYDGVESALSGEGGNIFQGISFWVAQRVPMRNDILSKIRNNGGTVVPLEKTAKYLIADHARKDAPPGSFSWKFITDSVQNGALQVEDRYRIGPDPHEPRPAGGGGLTRGARVAYSPSDDAALAKWVLSKPAAYRLGNKLYQEWEQLNSRHTWQSWRSRWSKTLSRLSDHELEMLAATVTDTSQSQLPASEQADLNVPIPASAPTVSRQPQPAPETTNAAVPPPAGGRAPFTREDDAIIAQWALKNSLVLGTKAFKILAEEHPHHNWDSWRTRWNKKLRLYSVDILRALAQEVPDEPLGSNPEPRPESSIDNNYPSTTKIESAKSKANQRRKTGPSQHVGSPKADEYLPAAKGTRDTSHTPQHDQNRKSEAHMLQERELELNETGGEEPEPYVSQAGGEGQAEMEEGVEEILDEDHDAGRDQFYRDLLNFCGCGPEDFEWPVICGPSGDHDVDLYDLAQAYDAQRVSFEHIKWEEVARDLGWPPEDETWAAEALQKCFMERLMEFLEAINDFAPGLAGDGAEDEDQEHGQELFPAAMASSPPMYRGNPKRDWEADHISSAASVIKRRRLRDVEIPSTPDEEIGVSRELRERHFISASPSIRRSGTQTSQQLPPLQRTPSKSDMGEARLVRPLMAGEIIDEMRGRREQDTSDEDTPPLTVLVHRIGDSRAGKATRRSLPASFHKATGPLALDLSPSPEELHEQTESVSDWLSRHLRTGYPKHILNLALHHTTMTPGPSADHVVDSLANENGIPIDLPGVWLPDEDRAVQQLMCTDLSSQASSAVELTEQKRLREEQRRLIQRHTWEGLSKRKAYLRKKLEEEGGQGAAVATRKKTSLQAKLEEQRKAAREGDAREATAAKSVVFTAEEKKRREIMLKRMMEEDEEEDD